MGAVGFEHENANFCDDELVFDDLIQGLNAPK